MKVSERDRALEREGGDRRAAGRPADEVRRRVDAQRAQQRGGVVGPVAQPARGVDRHALGVPEPAHVGREQAVARRRVVEQVLVEAAGREVAVDQDDRDAVLAARTRRAASPAGPCRRDESASRETICAHGTRGADDPDPGRTRPSSSPRCAPAPTLHRPWLYPPLDARGLPRLPRPARRAQVRLPRPPARGRRDRRLAQRV